MPNVAKLRGNEYEVGRIFAQTKNVGVTSSHADILLTPLSHTFSHAEFDGAKCAHLMERNAPYSH
jgi:hypothetical protein